MIDLNIIVSTFSNEDRQRFIAHLEKKNKRNDTKNIQLFNYLLNNELSSQDICFKLYGTLKKDAYHALRKRLYQSIIDFVANSSLQGESSTEMQIIKFILASRAFLQNKQCKIGYKILNKAEILAKEYFLFSLLNEIYHTKIQYAHTNDNENLDFLISDLIRNQKNIHLENELNIVYAKIRQTLNRITYKGEVLDFQTILNNTLKEHGIKTRDSMSFKSLYQLVSIASISAFVSKDYLKIEPFLIDTYKSILKYKNKEKQVYYHIQILYAIANALFRNKKFNESIYYLELMYEQMILNRKKYFNAFKLKYNLLLALNYNFSNKQLPAIKLLEQFSKIKHEDIETLLDIYLSLIMFNFQKNNLKDAHTIFSKFYHTDNWYIEKAGKEWVIKKNLMEILLHIDLGNVNLVESRLLSFKRNYSNYLKSINQQRVLTFLNLVEIFYKKPEIAKSKAFKDTIESSFNWIETYREDIFVLSFYSWLKSKIEDKDIYQTTLHLIKQAQQELKP